MSGCFKTAVAQVLLHPDVAVRPLGPQRLELERDGHTAILAVDASAAEVEPATWHPGFGASRATQRICIARGAPRLTTRLTW